MKYLALTLALSAGSLFAQKARSSYDQLAYRDAIEKYTNILSSNENDGEAMYNLATAYRLNNETTKAETWYSKAVNSSNQPDAQLYYAQMLLSNGKPSEAKEAFKKYKTNASAKDTERINDFITLCEDIENDRVQPKSFSVRESIFNSKSLDFSPAYYGDKIAFVSNRKGSFWSNSQIDQWTDSRYTDLFIADPANGYSVENFPKRINSNYHEGSAVFMKGNENIIFTSNNIKSRRLTDDLEENVRLQIVSSRLEEGKWTRPERLGFNNDNYSFCHPTLSNDESYMIFASDQPGGFGGMDLYMVKKSGDAWGVPVNLGPTINTMGNEVFPSLDENNNLYFSSDFHAGFGGLDLFKSDIRGTKWGKPTNLGLPLNSAKDDFGVISKSNFSNGYFSSNRTGDDQIYQFENLGSRQLIGRVVDCNTLEPIEGADVSIFQETNKLHDLVSDEDGYFTFDVGPDDEFFEATAKKMFYETNEGCPGRQDINVGEDVEIVLALNAGEANQRYSLCGRVLNEDCNYLLNDVSLKLINICNGEEVELSSDQNGEFTAQLSKDCKYKLVAEKDHFQTVVKTFSTDDLTSEDCLPLEVKMNSQVDLRDPNGGLLGEDGSGSGKILLKEGVSIDLYNVYFDLDKYFIREDAIEELLWVQKVLEDYPDMVVEISAHTDSRASDEYNITLSQNRAKAVVEYLKKRGVDVSRIKTKGYGETQLKNNCENDVDCTEIQHQRNRRVEFKVIKFDGEAIVSKEWKQYKN